jgi:sarcosine oxidase
MAKMDQLTNESGVLFHSPAGSAIVGSVPLVSRVGEALRIALSVLQLEGKQQYDMLATDELRERLPSITVPDGYQGLWEHGPAGYVNPIDMIRANNVVLKKQGGILLKSAATSLHGDASGTTVTVKTSSGDTVCASHVLIASGSFTDALLAVHHHKQSQVSSKEPLLRVPDPFGYKVSKRTVLMAEVSPEQLPSFANMPSLKFELPSGRSPWSTVGAKSEHDRIEASAVYVLPPIAYPDGKIYIKIGGGPNDFLDARPCDDPTGVNTELSAWMESEGSPVLAGELKRALATVLPGLTPLSYRTKPCFTACSSATPVLQATMTGRVAAVGTCHGKAAGPSLQIGEDLASWALGCAAQQQEQKPGSSHVYEWAMPPGALVTGNAKL